MLIYKCKCLGLPGLNYIRALLIVAIVLIVPVIFIVGITLPYLFNTIKITFPDIVIDKDVESYIAEKELLFENTDPRAKEKNHMA